MTSLVLSELFVTSLLLFEHQQKTDRYQFSGPYSPFLTGRMFVRRTYFGHFDEL